MEQFTLDETKIYPARHHFRVIVQAGSPARAAIELLLRDFAVVGTLRDANTSRGGRYVSLQVTVDLASRAEHLLLDAALRAVDGVRLLL